MNIPESGMAGHPVAAKRNEHNKDGVTILSALKPGNGCYALYDDKIHECVVERINISIHREKVEVEYQLKEVQKDRWRETEESKLVDSARVAPTKEQLLEKL